MRKLFSFCAAMLVALAVNAQTDFAAPGYSCAATDAALSGAAAKTDGPYTEPQSSSLCLVTADPSYLAWKDVSTSDPDNAVATWTVTATRGCYVTVTLNLGSVVIDSNKHIFEVKIKDDKGNVKGTLAEPAENADSDKQKVLDGTILLPAAGEYTVELRNNRSWGKGAVLSVILTYDSDAPSEVIAVSAIELNKTELALQVEEVEQLIATVSPDNATDPTVSWESDDEAVATVVDGFITAKAAGTATIKAKAGEKEATCEVTVAAATVPDVDFASACVLSAKKAQLDGKIWKMYTSETYKLYGDGGSNKQYGNALWTINVTHPCIVSGVLNGVEGGHLFELDLYKGEEFVATIAHPADKVWSKGEIALEGTLTFAEAGEYTLKLRNTQEWSSGKVAGITLTKSAELPKTFYLKPNANWLTAGARFALYTMGEEKWYDMTNVAGDEDYYKAEIPAGITQVIFCRMDGATTENNWDNKWNQTQDLTIEEGKDLCIIKGDDWDWGMWSKYGLKFKISGSMTSWSPTLESYENTYKLHLEAGAHQFKVVTPEEAWLGYSDLTAEYIAPELYSNQDGNVCFVLAAEGDVVVTYTGAVYKLEGAFVPATVKLIGINGWSEATDAIALIPEEDHKSTSASVYLEGWYYEFKVIVEGAWLAKQNEDGLYNLHREWTSVAGLTYEGKNIKLTMDAEDVVPGYYKFTWTYATGTLNVTFPEKGGATAINNTETAVKAQKMIENGQLFIIKNGNTYNAQGQLVK